MRFVVRVVVVALFAATIPFSLGTSAVAADDCGDVAFFGARGSGEDLSSNDGVGRTVNDYRRELFKRLARTGIDIRTFGVEFQAEGVGLIALPPHGVELFFNGMYTGVEVLKAQLENRHLLCDDELIVLAGYSQGAGVVNRAVVELNAEGRSDILDRIVAIDLFADLLRVGGAPYDVEVNGQPINMDGLAAARGAFPKASIPVSLHDVTRSWCDRQDVVCASSLRNAADNVGRYFLKYTKWVTPVSWVVTSVWNLATVHERYPEWATKPAAGLAAVEIVKAMGSHPSVQGQLLPAGEIGVSYTATIDASGGSPPYSWSLASGSLPQGLNLSPTGTLSGIPTISGNFEFSVRITDSKGRSDTGAILISVAGPDPDQFSCTSQTSIPLPECEALVAFYNALNGEDWPDNTWLTEPDPCTWLGIACWAAGHVSALALRPWTWYGVYYLSGAIPPELGALTNLVVLDLSQNNLSGAIPPELGSMTNLHTLDLSTNSLSGVIPPELGSTNLQELILSGNDLTGPIPPELGALTNLQELALSGNDLTGPIPPELGALTNLQELRLSANSLSGVIPPELGALTNLRVLGLWSNNVSGAIPPELGALTNLRYLDLVGNGLSGAIPPELGALTNLQELGLWRNNLTGPIPPELGALTNLQELNLSTNSLSGVIPPELGSMTNLQELNLSTNSLSGVIPPELGSMTNLQVLGLAANSLSGAIPPELATMNSLQTLALSSNSLSGAIPPELGSMTNLQELNLSTNDLSGAIPPEIGNLTNLRYLYLVSNSLSGAIPGELGTMISLQSLQLQRNSLTGPIPPEVGALTNLQALSLFDNALSGAIPPEIGALTNLQTLSLFDNALSGAIPPEIGGLTSLQELNLSSNSLAGAIPPELGAPTNLQRLILGFNDLSGAIPPEIGALTNLQVLLLLHNNLSGVVPPELMLLTNLIIPGYFSLGNQTGCLTASPEVAAWLDSADTAWNNGCQHPF